VFRGETVRWDDIGTIPFDALGAPGWNPRQHAGSSGAAAREAGGAPPHGSPRAGSPPGGANGSNGEAGPSRGAGASRGAGVVRGGRPDPARREQHGS
jgi:hypothetical protein